MFFAASQCPTLVGSNPQFCDLQSPQVNDLGATDNGAGIAWFETMTSTTPVDPQNFLTNGQRLFLDNAAGDCGNRQPVDITITGRPRGTNFQGLCVNDNGRPTLNDLNAVGNDIRWYDNAFGGNELPLATELVDGDVYYADQSNPITGCRTSRLFVQADIVIVSTPIGDQVQQFCDDPNNPALISDLVTDTQNRWYNTQGSVVPLSDQTVLVNGEDYFATSIDLPCESVGRLQVTVQLLAQNDAGGDSSLDLCQDELSTFGDIVLFDILNGSPDNSGRWNGPTTIRGASRGIINSADLSLTGSPFIYTYTVNSNTLCAPESSTITINVIRAQDAGLNGSTSLCEDDAPLDLFTLLGGSPDAGGTWSPPLTSGTGVLDPAIDPQGVYTYNLDPNNPCSTTSQASVTVSIQQLPDTGMDAAIDICITDSPIDLFMTLGGTPDSGGTWSPALDSGTGVFDPTIDADGNYTYSITPTAPCTTTPSSTISVTLSLPADAGTNGAVDLCEDDGIIDLFTQLGGSPDMGGTWSPSLASGTGVFDPRLDLEGVYTYEVSSNNSCNVIVSSTVTVDVDTIANAGNDGTIEICITDASINLISVLGGTPDAGGVWTPALSSGSGIFDPSIDPQGDYTYQVGLNSTCGVEDMAIATVIVQDIPEAGLDGSVVLCDDQPPVDLFNFLGGNPDAGGLWNPALSSGTGFFNPSVDANGTYTYTIDSGSPCNLIVSSTVLVSIEESPDAGISSSVQLCSNNSAIDLFTLLGGRPDSGGVWSPTLASGSGILDPAVDVEGIYSYTVNPTSPCNNSDSATINVSIQAAPDPGIDSSISLCEDESRIDLFTVLGGSPDSGGVWTPTLVSGSGIFNPAIDNAGIYTYTLNSTAPCTGDQTSQVTVDVQDIANAGLDRSIELCDSDSMVDLFTVLGGTPDAGGTWSPALQSGTGVFDPSVDPEGIYTYSIDPTAPCTLTSSATIDVSVESSPDAGLDSSVRLCEDATPIDLFNVLGGSPDTGGIWSPALSSGTGIFDPSQDPEGAYTYTIENLICALTVSSEVIVTIQEVSNAGVDSNIDLCETDPAIDLYAILGGTPDIGGVWSPSLQSGTGVFDPAVDPEGFIPTL